MIKKNNAFTLIELLVAITIVFLLLGIILYAANGARESSRTTVCATNAMQLSHALSLYVNDYDSTYPVVAHAVFKDSGDGGSSGHGASWYSYVFPYVNGQDDRKSIYCPSVNSVNTLSSINLETEFSSGVSSGYAYNKNLSQKNYNVTKIETEQSVHYFDAKTESDIGYSSLVVVFADARVGIVAINKPDTDMHALLYVDLRDLIEKQPSGATRHHGGANYTFIDGHLKWFKPEQLSKNEKCDGETPGFGL